MKRSNLLLLAVSIIAAACQPAVDRFAVNGQISQADGKTLYLDHMGLDKVTVTDSVKLGADGSFSFSQPAPDGCFDIYRLRLDGQVISLIVDSTETITVSASMPDIQTGYTVSGSKESARLKDLVMYQMDFIKELKQVSQQYAGPETGVRQQRISELVDVFKSDVMMEYILPDPSSAVAYYALFTSVNGQLLFNPQAERQDAKCYAAVATQMDMLYPDAVRTRHLHNLALKSMGKTAPAAPLSDEKIQELSAKISESGLIDIELPDYQGKQRKLSDLIGNVVLLDFTAFAAGYSINYNLNLRRLYDMFADRGLSIYQISYDTDVHFWTQSAANLPWTCVRDESFMSSEYLKLYNVQQLPTVFLIDRNGDIVDRPASTDELEEKIAALLDK